jgi:[ribosomal protein S18]-alanine N-acetyltransferase
VRTLTVATLPLGLDRLDEVVAIEQAVSPRPWTSATWREELTRDDRCYVAAVEDGRLVGYAGCSLGAGEANVLTVAVAPDAQRRGHGGRLVATLLAEVTARGIGAVTLEVRRSSASAQRLYRHAGFVSAGVRPGYYQDDGEDAVIMWWHGPEPADTDDGRR